LKNSFVWDAITLPAVAGARYAGRRNRAHDGLANPSYEESLVIARGLWLLTRKDEGEMAGVCDASRPLPRDATDRPTHDRARVNRGLFGRHKEDIRIL
jgi:hypothetical protein